MFRIRYLCSELQCTVTGFSVLFYLIQTKEIFVFEHVIILEFFPTICYGLFYVKASKSLDHNFKKRSRLPIYRICLHLTYRGTCSSRFISIEEMISVWFRTLYYVEGIDRFDEGPCTFFEFSHFYRIRIQMIDLYLMCYTLFTNITFLKVKYFSVIRSTI